MCWSPLPSHHLLSPTGHGDASDAAIHKSIVSQLLGAIAKERLQGQSWVMQTEAANLNLPSHGI